MSTPVSERITIYKNFNTKGPVISLRYQNTLSHSSFPYIKHYSVDNTICREVKSEVLSSLFILETL